MVLTETESFVAELATVDALGAGLATGPAGDPQRLPHIFTCAPIFS